MEKTINQVGPAEYELEIKATAEELAPEIDKALRAQRNRTQLKGFRPGKVPVQLVKKMYGRALAYGVAEGTIQKTFEEVRDSGEYDVLGAPKMTDLDYDLDQDLRAVVRFGIRPDIEMKDLSGEKVTKLVHEVTDAEVEEELERLRRREADLAPLEEPIGKEDNVILDIQRLDDATRTPIVGDKEEGVSFFLDDPRLKDDLRNALLNKKTGDTFEVDLPHEGDHHDDPQPEMPELPEPQGEHARHPHTHAYQITIKEAKRRDIPEMDEEFVKKVTKGKAENETGLRAELRKELERSWTENAREFLNQSIVERMLELHPISIPSSLEDVYLDSFIEDVKQRSNGKLPDGFNEQAFREANRDEASKQAHWALLRDKVIEQEKLEVSDEDLDKHLSELSGGGDEISPDMLRQFYRSMPGLMERMQQRVMSEKIFAALETRFKIEEKNREELEKEIEERNAQEANPS